MKSRLEPCVQQSPREEHLGYCPRGIPGLPMELWPGSTMDSYQIVGLRCILEHAYQRNQFYRNKCEQVGIGPEQLRKISDLARFPFTTKSELCGAPWKLLAVNKDDVCQIHMSTGTTSERIGDHLYSVLTWDDIFFNEVANRFGFMMPSRPGDVVVVALPYEMSSAGFSMHRAYQHSAECIVVNVGKGGFYSDPRKTALIMKDLNARILCTTASYALQLSESALSCGVDPSRDLDLKFIWLGGEGFSTALRERIESLWNCPCLGYYSTLECGPLGVECLAHDGFHIAENYAVIEVVDPSTGEVLPEGATGELCVTNLYRYGSPMIRYRTQDIGRIERSPCRCCVERPRVILKGRAQQQVRFSKRTSSLYELEDRIYRLEAMGNNYKLDIDGDRIVLTAEVRPGHEKNVLERDLLGVLGEFGDVHLQVVDYVPRTLGKAVRISRGSTKTAPL